MEWGGILSSVGWWMDNKVKIWALGWGIWWWLNNSIRSFYTVIGGGSSNSTTWYNSVVVGWDTNKAYSWWVVLWWKLNRAYSWWVVLWWLSNNAKWENSLVLWRYAKWHENSFAWSGEAQPNMARINADSGVLIWTVTPVDGVSLVINWSIKLSKWSDITWAITMNDSWCMTVYDWKSAHALGSSESVCGVASWCQFGSTLLQNWDVVTGYDVSYATNCDVRTVQVKCENWRLKEVQGLWKGGVYPYCYNTSSMGRGNLDVDGNGIVYYAQDFGLVNSCGVASKCLVPSCDVNWDGWCNVSDVNYYNNLFF